MYRMAQELCGRFHTLGRRTCGSPGHIRAPTPQLSAQTWLVTDEPYVVLEMPAPMIASLSAGFQTALDGMVPQLPNTQARIERHPDRVALVLHGCTYWSDVPFDQWPADGPCQIIVVEAGLLQGSERRREALLVDLINCGHALVAVNQICTPRASPLA